MPKRHYREQEIYTPTCHSCDHPVELPARSAPDGDAKEIGLSIKGATLHEKKYSRWVRIPARECVKDGERSWTPVIECASKEAKYAIRDAVVAAYDLHSGGGAR